MFEKTVKWTSAIRVKSLLVEHQGNKNNVCLNENKCTEREKS